MFYWLNTLNDDDVAEKPRVANSVYYQSPSVNSPTYYVIYLFTYLLIQ